MDGRIAVKRPHEEKTTLKYGDGFHYNIYRQTQPFTAAASCKKNCSNNLKVSETHSGKDGTSFTGSLAEVYEKALNNVLNIQPNFKMDENLNDKNTMPEKKPLAALDTQYFQAPGGCKLLHPPRNDTHLLQQRICDEKKLNPTNKSAFHVPEKRRLPNGQSHYGNWSHDHPFPYTVNYPGEYYPLVHRPPYYPRYDNLFLERFNYYPGPRRREFPVFTHVLPWLQFERDYKPMTSSPKKPITSPRYGDMSTKGTLGYDTRKDTKDVAQLQFGPMPLSREDKTADQKQIENVGSGSHENSRMRNGEKCVKSPDLYNVKTRRMRAVDKRHDLNTTNKKDSFGSPKELFLFSLGLTRVDKYHEG